MITYAKLWFLLADRGMKRTDLLKEPVKLTSATLAKLGKNENVNTDTIDRICKGLDCQPGDIMEYIDVDKAKLETEKIHRQFQEALRKLAIAENKDPDKMIEEIKSILPEEQRYLVDQPIDWEKEAKK